MRGVIQAANQTRAGVTVSARYLTLFLILTTGCGWAFQLASAPQPEEHQASIEGKVTVDGRQVHESAVSGVLVKLSAGSAPAESLSTISDAEGHYRFAPLFPGVYTIETQLDGFESFAESVVLTDGETRIENVRLTLANVVQKVDVQEKETVVLTESADSSTTFGGSQFTALPLTERKFKAALPLVPGVVRTKDGTLNFKGAPENQGMLLVDSAQTVDPVTGSFSIPIPLDSIQTLTVDKVPYEAEYGGFSGGLTTIETKPPSGAWNFGVMDFVPGFRAKQGPIGVGVGAVAGTMAGSIGDVYAAGGRRGFSGRSFNVVDPWKVCGSRRH